MVEKTLTGALIILRAFKSQEGKTETQEGCSKLTSLKGEKMQVLVNSWPVQGSARVGRRVQRSRERSEGTITITADFLSVDGLQNVPTSYLNHR